MLKPNLLIHIKKYNKNGSASLEAAILIPIVVIILIFQIRLIQCVAMQTALEKAVNNTSDILCRYALLYHEYGIGELENHSLEKLGQYLSEKTSSNDGKNILTKYINLRYCAETGDNILYSQVAKAICTQYLNEDKLVKFGFLDYDGLSFSGSLFFDDDSDIIVLKAKLKYEGKYTVGASTKSRAWIKGDNPILSIEESGISIWTLNNFARGKILRATFGANLKYDYPVIAIFKSNGEAVMIKSIDFTKDTYKSQAKFRYEITSMLDKLKEFIGTVGAPGLETNEIIRPEQIKSKKLMLIMPTNDMPENLASVLKEMTLKASGYGILFEIIPYQKSP